VTRIADITGLDRIGIPVYSAIVPCSDDGISVYNGKGSRPIDAKTGALMEAIERQTALKARLPYIEESYVELKKKARALDPWSVNQPIFEDFNSESPCTWVSGQDLLSGEACWVPAQLGGYLWNELPHGSPYKMHDTSGLASGNNYLEAVCHALCELMERDAWTFAELGASYLPTMRWRMLAGRSAGHSDDLDYCPEVEVPGGNDLLRAFREAGFEPQVRDVTSSLGVPTFLASVVDESVAGFPMAHLGFGCSPNAEVALRRALTEVAQTRCVDIQGVREDIIEADAPKEIFAPHTRRILAVDRTRWPLGRSRACRPFQAIASQTFEDMHQDLQWLLHRLEAAGLTQAVVVDFTPDDTTHSVVRVIVPGIEHWASNHGRIGERATQFWRSHV
jgi:ribosomal protein S12 methylthiotransferase accessory factor